MAGQCGAAAWAWPRQGPPFSTLTSSLPYSPNPLSPLPSSDSDPCPCRRSSYWPHTLTYDSAACARAPQPIFLFSCSTPLIAQHAASSIPQALPSINTTRGICRPLSTATTAGPRLEA
eukprot:scaffold954_cov111-Isochrysis_galbana.AAC.3